MATRNPSDINKKLAALTPEQARDLSAHLNDAYMGKRKEQDSKKSAKKQTGKGTKK